MTTLIITNGDGAASGLQAAGIAGAILPWRDMLHDGPVPRGDLATVSGIRAAFLAEALGLDPDAVRADFARRDGEIHAHQDHEAAELWFEHDLYDQLQLIQLLNYFSEQPARSGLILVQASHYLGMMDAAQLAALADTRAPVTALQLETGRAAWEAFTAPTPEALAAFATAPHPCLSHLAPALRRLLAELPAPRSGLSLTEARILARLAAGPVAAGRIYAAVDAMEVARFLGDLPFFLRLDGLAFAPEPLITGLARPLRDCGPLAFTPGEDDEAERAYRAHAGSILTLTPAGGAALAGAFDHARENRVARFMGGTQIGPDALWRFDRDKGALIAPGSGEA